MALQFDLDSLMGIDSATWQNMFRQMEHQAHQSAKAKTGPFIFHGEVDCPEEMLYYLPSPWSKFNMQVRPTGSRPWRATSSPQEMQRLNV